MPGECALDFLSAIRARRQHPTHEFYGFPSSPPSERMHSAMPFGVVVAGLEVERRMEPPPKQRHPYSLTPIGARIAEAGFTGGDCLSE